jgi:hypothetical protein
VGETLQFRRAAQTKRIEKSAAELFGTSQHIITFGYSDDEISFVIKGIQGNIITESYRGTPISEMEGMSDDAMKNRLAEITANTARLLSF